MRSALLVLRQNVQHKLTAHLRRNVFDDVPKFARAELGTACLTLASLHTESHCQIPTYPPSYLPTYLLACLSVSTYHLLTYLPTYLHTNQITDLPTNLPIYLATYPIKHGIM